MLVEAVSALGIRVAYVRTDGRPVGVVAGAAMGGREMSRLPTTDDLHSTATSRPRFRSRFLLLWASAVISATLVLPYALTLQSKALESLPVPLPIALVVSMLQSAALLAAAVFAGLRAADAVRLRTPLTDAWVGRKSVVTAFKELRPRSTIALGLVVGMTIVVVDALVFVPLLPEISAPNPALRPSRLAGFLASFYGGIAEEVLTRLFLVSVIVWVLRGRAVWLAIVAAALLFAAGHLPVASAISALTPLFVARVMLLNSIGGLVFGWLYWHRGLEAAMLAHFSADLVIHVLVGT
jgi:hypothetical protein